MHIPGLAPASYMQSTMRARRPLRVGTDIMRLTSSSPVEQTRYNTINIKTEVSLSASEASLRKMAAMQPSAQGRTFEVKGMTMNLKDSEDGTRTLLVQQKGQADQTFTFKGDGRLMQGKNGQMELVSGKEALSGGVLRAQSEGEVLLREDAKLVDTGKFSASVVSLGSGPATYTSSGGKTVYTGIFNESTITDTGEEASFFGLFDKSTISVTGKGNFDGAYNESYVKGGRNGNIFHGSYAASEVRGDAGKDVFSGNFIRQSTLYGLDGNDTFNGIYANSTLDAGAGNDSIGKEATLVKNLDKKRYDVSATIKDSVIIGGEGDDTLTGVVINSQAELGEGSDTTRGIYRDSIVDTGNGADTVTAYYAHNGKFITGDGDDSVSLATSVATDVDAGTGENSVTFGVSEGDTMIMSTESGGSVSLKGMRFIEDGDESTATAFGVVEGNHVAADEFNGSVEVTAWVDGVKSILESARPEPDEAGKNGLEPADKAALVEKAEKEAEAKKTTEQAEKKEAEVKEAEAKAQAGRLEPQTGAGQTAQNTDAERAEAAALARAEQAARKARAQKALNETRMQFAGIEGEEAGDENVRSDYYAVRLSQPQQADQDIAGSDLGRTGGWAAAPKEGSPVLQQKRRALQAYMQQGAWV